MPKEAIPKFLFGAVVLVPASQADGLADMICDDGGSERALRGDLVSLSDKPIMQHEIELRNTYF